MTCSSRGETAPRETGLPQSPRTVIKLAAIISVFVVYAVFSRRLETRIGGPIVFMTLGIVFAEPYLDWFTLDLNSTVIQVLLSFFVFGALAVGPLIQDLTIEMVAYAALSLVLIRPVAVAISLIGSGDGIRTTAFVGWFGPRGLPTLVLALILVFERFQFSSGALMVDIIVATVALGVYAHGFTTEPLSNRYADWCERSNAGSDPATGSS